MALESRRWLKWDEAAELLGLDREGLRQAMLEDFLSPQTAARLPVYYDTNGWDKVVHLRWGWGRTVREHSKDLEAHGHDADLVFEDGLVFKASGEANDCSWQTTHDHRTGWNDCFYASGRFVVDPDSVRYACREDGDFRVQGVALIPEGWEYPDDFYFRMIRQDGISDMTPPSSLYSDVVFRTSDVLKIKDNGSAISGPKVGAAEKELSSRERNNLLRIIRALDVMANLPAKAYADSIEAQLKRIELQSPSDDTIRKAIEAARALKS